MLVAVLCIRQNLKAAEFTCTQGHIAVTFFTIVIRLVAGIHQNLFVYDLFLAAIRLHLGIGGQYKQFGPQNLESCGSPLHTDFVEVYAVSPLERIIIPYPSLVVNFRGVFKKSRSHSSLCGNGTDIGVIVANSVLATWHQTQDLVFSIGSSPPIMGFFTVASTIS